MFENKTGQDSPWRCLENTHWRLGNGLILEWPSILKVGNDVSFLSNLHMPTQLWKYYLLFDWQLAETRPHIGHNRIWRVHGVKCWLKTSNGLFESTIAGLQALRQLPSETSLIFHCMSTWIASHDIVFMLELVQTRGRARKLNFNDIGEDCQRRRIQGVLFGPCCLCPPPAGPWPSAGHEASEPHLQSEPQSWGSSTTPTNCWPIHRRDDSTTATLWPCSLCWRQAAMPSNTIKIYSKSSIHWSESGCSRPSLASFSYLWS